MEAFQPTMTARLTAKILVRLVYAFAALVALVPVIALVADPGDPMEKHLFRVVVCPLVACGIVALGMLLSLLLQALVAYIESHHARHDAMRRRFLEEATDEESPGPETDYRAGRP